MRWRRTVGWTAAALVGLILVGIVGGYFYLKSSGFKEYALRTIVQRTDDATGGRTEIGNLDFRLSTLTAHLYNITVHGSEAPNQAPLLQVDKLTVGLKIQSVLHRRVFLSELFIDHPVAHLRVDREGKSNIPQVPPGQSSSHTDVFDLGVRHVLLSNGEINYNDKKSALDADLFNLGTEIRFNPFVSSYEGAISYENGHLRYAEYSPLAHSLKAKFNATRSRLSLESAEMKVGASTVSLHADVANYSNPTVEGDYDVRIHMQDFRPMSPAVTPAGDVTLSGKIHYRCADQPFLHCLELDGQLASEAIAASSSQGHLDLRKLQGRYQLANGTLQARNIGAQLLGGRVNADLTIQNLDATAASRVRMSLVGISLQAAQQAIRRPDAKTVSLLGTLDGTADASWKGSVSNVMAHTDLRLRASANSHGTPPSAKIPVDGSVHATYDGARTVITFRQTTLHIPSTTLSVEGEVSNNSNLQIQAAANDLHQLALLASALRPSQTAATEISGSAALHATMHGSMKSPHFAGQANAQNLQVQGSQWRSAKLAIEASPSRVAVQNGSLENAHQGSASFSANVALRNWSYIPSDPIAANLSVQRMSVTDLQKLANLQYPVSGDLSAEISVHGSQLNPVGAGSATIVNARAYDEPVQKLQVKFHADKGSLASTLDVSLSAGSANASLSYTPKTKAYTVSLNAPSLVLQKLHTVQTKNVPLTGTLKATVSGEGTLDNPQLTATLELPELQVRQNSISKMKAELHVGNQRADLNLSSQVAQSSLQAHGRVNLTGDYYTEAAMDTTSVPLDPLLAMYVSSLPEGFKGQTEFHATFKGPLKDKTQIEAHLTIPVLKASYQSLEIGTAGPIRADYAHSVVTLQPAELRGTGTSLRVQGSIPLGGNTAPNLTAQGSIDVSLLRLIQPDVQSSGTLALDLRASGSATSPAVHGQVHVNDVSISTPTAPLGVEKLKGILDISNNRVRISSFTGQVGGGQVIMGGSVTYRPNLQFDVSLQSNSVRLRYPDGLRAVLDGNLIFIGTTESSVLNGRVLIDTLSFTPDFDLAKFSDQFSGNSVPAQPGLADNVKLSIGVQSKGQLSATSSQVSVEGRVNVHVIGTAANPVITGRTDLTSGELFYRNVRYQLQRGIITFDDPNQTEPVLNVSVNTIVEQYNLTLTLRGPFDKLSTSYTSDPPLSTADIINLIARGKTTQESAAASQSTDSMIASQAASQVTNSVQKLAGISSLQIDPLLGGNNQNPSARIALQQRVTKNFLFTFSSDISQPGSQIVQGDYQINKRWSVSVARDQVGGVSVDGKFHTRF
jgi:translocation and assembly module TamB